MVKIDIYLKELAQNNRRVILPDLGAFLLKDNPGGSKTIIFSSFLRYDDGFLEDAIAQKANITKPEASLAVKKLIAEIKTMTAFSTAVEISSRFNNFGMVVKMTVT